MLDETRKVYETERQPEVLRQASSFFNVMTEGRYVRVIAPLDGGDIQVERADGVRLAPQLLSRGTAEQLYLAMRFALVREYATHVDPLPVVFDDIFVNFDPGRSRTSLKSAAGVVRHASSIIVYLPSAPGETGRRDDSRSEDFSLVRTQQALCNCGTLKYSESALCVSLLAEP